MSSGHSQPTSIKRKVLHDTKLSFQPVKKQKNQENNSENSVQMISSAKKPAVATSAPKKLVIKDFKVKPKLPEKFEEETWEKLREAVFAVHSKQPVNCSLEELYKASENYCHTPISSAKLYQKLQEECQKHIQAELLKLRERTGDNVVFLTHLNTCWEDHCSDMLFIRSIFLYLDRTYVIQNPEVKSLWDLGLQLFREIIAKNPLVEQRTISGLLTLIEMERTGEAIERGLIKNLLRMYSALQIYVEVFQDKMLEQSRIFYESESSRYINHTDIADYLKHIEKRLSEENDRLLNYLDPVSRKPLILVVEKCMIENHVQAMVDKGFDSLMKQNRDDDLGRMHSLFCRVNAVEKLKVAFNLYIKNTGVSLVSDPEKDNTLVQELLDFRLQLDQILEKSFQKKEQFAYALKEAFESFINVRQNKPSELIARFIHEKFSSNKNSSEEELDNLMDKVLVLFRYIQGKDIFEAFYKKFLAKRLLLGKTESIDAEKSMISKLKIECGSGFTNKLEGMFKDMETSKDLNIDFQSKFGESFKEMEMNVQVLTTGYWPPVPAMHLKLPDDMLNCQQIFEKYYASRFNARRLSWQTVLGHCVLRAIFPKGKKELYLSLHQTIVLLLFNTIDTLTFQEIVNASGIEEKELKKVLASLTLGKVKILHRNSASKDLTPEDTFSYNKDFSNKLYKIKINSFQIKDTVEESQKTTEGVFQDRQYQIDAAIVRIMKTRKTLTHNNLVAELYNQLKFPMKLPDIKKRIESLIEREYLERDSSNSQLYNYLA